MGVGAVKRRYSRRSVADDLASLEKSLWGETYDTKTRGYMQCFPNSGENPRLRYFFRDKTQSHVQIGAYAIINTDTRVMSKRETHLGYHTFHPKSPEMAHAPTTSPRQDRTKGADYPAWIMGDVFGAAAGQGQNERRGRKPYGLRFASCETPELFEYEGTQLLLIAAREG